jgi:hypothetical protein
MDHITFAGAAANIYGGSGNDTLTGSDEGSDTIRGGTGTDTVSGGANEEEDDDVDTDGSNGPRGGRGGRGGPGGGGGYGSDATSAGRASAAGTTAAAGSGSAGNSAIARLTLPHGSGQKSRSTTSGSPAGGLFFVGEQNFSAHSGKIAPASRNNVG